MINWLILFAFINNIFAFGLNVLEIGMHSNLASDKIDHATSVLDECSVCLKINLVCIDSTNLTKPVWWCIQCVQVFEISNIERISC